jgi:hypothetical protein
MPRHFFFALFFWRLVMPKRFIQMPPVGMVLLACCLTGAAWGKLPPLSDEAKAKAAEAAAKTAYNGKVDGFQLCKAQDKVVAHVAKAGKSGSGAKPTGSACVDPGPFVYTPAVPAATAAGTAVPASAPAAAAAAAPPAKPGPVAPAKKS